MKKYLIANWKMTMTKKAANQYFVAINKLRINNLYLGFAIPYIFLDEARKKCKWDILAQEVSAYDFGAYTGQISYQHLLDFNIYGSIVGHSELRQYTSNTDKIINLKVKKLLANQMQVVLCIGEDKDTYVKNQTISFLFKQLKTNLQGIDLKKHKKQIVIAYEPIWSIGTGKIPNNEEIYYVIKKIKEKYPFDVIYGGSVNEKNIDSLKTIKNLNGFLVGSASTNCKSFKILINKMME